MKIALLTFYTSEYQSLADITIPNRDEWCKAHGYEHIVKVGPYKGLPYYAYDRLAYVRDLLDRENAPDIIWVLNVQGVITNMTRRLEPVLDDEHDFWVNKDCHGLNLGSFIVRNTNWSRSWLDFLISMEPRYRNEPWKEQKCIMDWWQHEQWTWKIHLLPQRAINSYQYWRYNPWPPETPGNWRKGDLALSLPGLNLEQRLEAVKQILESDMVVR